MSDYAFFQNIAGATPTTNPGEWTFRFNVLYISDQGQVPREQLIECAMQTQFPGQTQMASDMINCIIQTGIDNNFDVNVAEHIFIPGGQRLPLAQQMAPK